MLLKRCCAWKGSTAIPTATALHCKWGKGPKVTGTRVLGCALAAVSQHTGRTAARRSYKGKVQQNRNAAFHSIVK